MKSQLENEKESLAAATPVEWNGDGMIYCPALDFRYGEGGFFGTLEDVVELAKVYEMTGVIEAFVTNPQPPQKPSVEDIVEGMTQDSHECAYENILDNSATEEFEKALEKWYAAICENHMCLTFFADKSRKLVIDLDTWE